MIDMRHTDKTNQILLGFILIVATFLRFYQFFELPFMWDELSAWSRINYNSFSELIEKGVKPDGHPAGVQVFLFYWIKWFGDQEWVVKLPFNIMGIVSIWLIYKIGSIWFSQQSGLVAASFAASLQFFVLYSPIARPYSSGLFITLMMVLFWSLYLFKTPKRIYLIAFIAFAALSAYNHHFSLLFASIVGLSGLIIIPKNLLKEYILSGIIIFLLYLPHLNIFFHQLGVGGIGGNGLWLAQPDWSFIIEFLSWSFQYSFINAFLILAFLVKTIYYCYKNYTSLIAKKTFLLVIWFSLPIIIGLLYSIYVNPVLQFSMLIFSFPYLLILLSTFAIRISKSMLISVIAVILIANIYSLFIHRNHFEIIKKQPFAVTAQLASEKQNSCFVIYNTIPEYQQYYFHKYQIDDIPNISLYNNSISEKELDSILRNITEPNIISCGLPLHYEYVIKRHFPYFVKKENAYTMDCYVFSKDKNDVRSQFSEIIYFNDFLSEKSFWTVDQSRIKTDSFNQKYFEFNQNQIWGFSLRDSIKKYSNNSILDFEAQIITDNDDISPLWVFSAKIGKEQKFWRGQKIVLLENKEVNTYQSFFSIDTRWIDSNFSRDSLEWQVYFWNKNQDSFKIQSFSMYNRHPNPIKYSLFENIR